MRLRSNQSALLLILAPLLLAGCAPGAQEAQPPLQSTTWTLAAMGPDDNVSPVLATTEVTIEFDAGEVAGSAGCNLYFGAYSDEADGTFSVSEVAWTERACLEPGVMEQEQRYLEALLAADSYEVTNGTLRITGNGYVLLFS